ncbi:hypothetical protein HY29_13800 [Hyphomonas beringensis]|uniref:diguanylate cyclase n=1 Tax=Hyphomonas beringensis TaxID=1280946 RepID=A0A062UET8_9PROT|nr:hypothetical protein HY29_13800 [Hyphomonas beringensis]
MQVSDRTKDVIESLTFFAFVAITALCLSFTFSIIVYSLGLPADPENFIVANLFIATCVAVPTGAIAAQHEFRMRIYQRTLEDIASTDPLTGLLNRKFFRQFAVEELARMKRTEVTSAIALFDLDYFKAVNDRYGHGGGDVVLREIAAVAYSELRGPFDRLGRWGGEEFVIMLSNVELEQAQSVCERVRASIERHMIFLDGQPVNVTASFGLALLPPGADFDKVLEQADHALYDSKAKGRNCVSVLGRPQRVAA